MSTKSLINLGREDIAKVAQVIFASDLNTDFRSEGVSMRAEVDPDDVTLVEIITIATGSRAPVRVRAKYQDLAYDAIVALREICK